MGSDMNPFAVHQTLSFLPLLPLRVSAVNSVIGVFIVIQTFDPHWSIDHTQLQDVSAGC